MFCVGAASTTQEISLEQLVALEARVSCCLQLSQSSSTVRSIGLHSQDVRHTVLGANQSSDRGPTVGLAHCRVEGSSNPSCGSVPILDHLSLYQWRPHACCLSHCSLPVEISRVLSQLLLAASGDLTCVVSATARCQCQVVCTRHNMARQ